MKTILGLSTQEQFGLPIDEQLRLFHKAGFEAFFTRWTSAEDAARWQKTAREERLLYQSIHAPDNHILDLWSADSSTENAVGELNHCLETCARLEIPILVTHVVQTFGFTISPEQGIANFTRLARRGRELGVTLALENLQCEEYTELLLEHVPEAGFCWDCGHEHAYHASNELMPKWGSRLVCTHLNDNLGQSGTEIHWRDDLHMIPGDGNVDWEHVMAQLDANGYEGVMMFELKKTMYPDMPMEEYVKKAYERACQVTQLRNG